MSLVHGGVLWLQFEPYVHCRGGSGEGRHRGKEVTRLSSNSSSTLLSVDLGYLGVRLLLLLRLAFHQV